MSAPTSSAASRLPALSPGWVASFEAILTAGPGATGNVGLSGEGLAPPPAWPGFRSVVVDDVVPESEAVVSLRIKSADGTPFPPALPGQFVTLRLRVADGEPPVSRSYSLSNAPGSPDYRISVKREEHGLVSAYIYSAVQAGASLEMAAARGRFILESGRRPGRADLRGDRGDARCSRCCTPWRRRRRRARCGGCTVRATADEHPFAAEVQQLLGQLPHAHRVICYSAPLAGEQLGVDYDVAGRLSESVLREQDLPAGGTVVHLRAGRLHGRHAAGAASTLGARPCARPHRDLRQRARVDARHRGHAGDASARAAGGAGNRTRGHVCPQRPDRPVAARLRQPARLRRSVRRARRAGPAARASATPARSGSWPAPCQLRPGRRSTRRPRARCSSAARRRRPRSSSTSDGGSPDTAAMTTSEPRATEHVRTSLAAVCTELSGEGGMTPAAVAGRPARAEGGAHRGAGGFGQLSRRADRARAVPGQARSAVRSGQRMRRRHHGNRRGGRGFRGRRPGAGPARLRLFRVRGRRDAESPAGAPDPGRDAVRRGRVVQPRLRHRLPRPHSPRRSEGRRIGGRARRRRWMRHGGRADRQGRRSDGHRGGRRPGEVRTGTRTRRRRRARPPADPVAFGGGEGGDRRPGSRRGLRRRRRPPMPASSCAAWPGTAAT